MAASGTNRLDGAARTVAPPIAPSAAAATKLALAEKHIRQSGITDASWDRMMKYLCAIALVGCTSRAEVGTTETTAAVLRPIKVVATEPAVADITRAECARAQACGAVISRGIYRDASYCETDIDRAVRDELLTDRCAYVEREGIAKCLTAIRTESCAELNFTEHVPPACRRAALCR